MTTTESVFACPGCGAPTPSSTTRCEHCRIRLVGELAMQLWRLDQQILGLRARRERIVAALRRDDDAADVGGGDVLPSVRSAAGPGSETRRALLTLGAICLIAALTAGTALIWPALGVGGQTAVLLAMTIAVLTGAVRVQHRLPATAEALAAVGVAATAVDAVAGRRLVAPGLSGAASHTYWFAAALLASLALAYVGSRARHLRIPAMGAVLAAYGVVVALLAPQTSDGVAVLGVLGVALSVAMLRGADLLPMSQLAVRGTAAAGGVGFTVVGAVAALTGASGWGTALFSGLVLSAGLALAPDLLGEAGLETGRRPLANAGGSLAAALALRADVVPLHTASLTTAGVAAALIALVAATRSTAWRMSVAAYAGAAAVLVEVAAQLSLQRDAVAGTNLAAAAAGLAVVGVVLAVGSVVSPRADGAAAAAAGATCALLGTVAEATGSGGWLAAADAAAVTATGVFLFAFYVLLMTTRARDTAVVAAVAATAGAAGSIAVAVSIALRDVTTVEAYVVAPAVVTWALGLFALRRAPSLPSWTLLPGLAVTTVPTLFVALHGDVSRQVIVLLAAGAFVMLGAQARLMSPLVVGAAEVLLVVARVVGPDVARLPRWLTLGVLGVALIGLGSTWERRLQDVRAVAQRLRPQIAALR